MKTFLFILLNSRQVVFSKNENRERGTQFQNVKAYDFVLPSKIRIVVVKKKSVKRLRKIRFVCELLHNNQNIN